MQPPTLRQKIVVLTGAGISKESGLDTFRDKDSLWQKHDAMRLSSIEGFEQEPQAVHVYTSGGAGLNPVTR